MPKIIGVISFKGGVSKTTTAVHIAAHLSARGKTVAVDGDDRNRSLMNWASGESLPFEVMSMMEAFNSKGVEYLVVDVRGGLPDVELFDLAKACDLLLIPANPEVMSLDGMRRTFDVLRDEEERRGKPWQAKVATVLTMVRPGRKLEQAKAALGALGIPVLEHTVRASEAFKDASSMGVLVRDVKTNSLAHECWNDYGAVVAESLRLVGEKQ